MKKSIKYIIIFVIAIIIVCAYFGYISFFNPDSKSVNAQINAMNENTEKIDIEDSSEDVLENNIEDSQNEIDEPVEEEQEVVDEQENTVDNQQNTLSSNNDSEVEDANDEQKAIEIVKKDWGITDGVTYVAETINSEGNYVISVRDANTRNAIAWYTVNPKTGEFSN